MCQQALVTEQVSSRDNDDNYIVMLMQLSLNLAKYMRFVWFSRYLSYTLDPSKIRKQDATSTIIHIANNVAGQSLAWDFVRANWEYIFNQ